ncbi:MAG: heparinase II/III family protein [Alphaproteobacteria bacterium]|nr:heparinase II/III family protein [Alphaproteobacteria bacterium]
MANESDTPARPGGFRVSSLWSWLPWLSAPRGVRAEVPEVWPGDPDAGSRLLNGHFAHAGETHRLDVDNPVLPETASDDWSRWFHGHGWLEDLGALGGGKAPYFSRAWVNLWIEREAEWPALAHTPEVTAERLMNWVRHWTFLVREDAAGPFGTLLRHTAGRDARRLLGTLPLPSTGFARLHTAAGQAYGAFALLGGEGRMTRTRRRLEEEVAAQVLGDGGHVERNPEQLARVLKDLLELKAMFIATTGEVPGFVQNAIDRSAPMLRALRHPDGGLAVFNGGLESEPAWLDQMLAHTDSKGLAVAGAPHTRFRRLQAGDVCLIMDCGEPAPVGRSPHAGTLSFELSIGKRRMIVNCGSRSGHSAGSDAIWRTALAGTAAHSTLTVNDTSSAAFDAEGRIRRGPVDVRCEHQEQDDGQGVIASHDGYATAFGLTHQRTVYVAAHGCDVRGEDRLIGTGGEYYTVRFHLHPDVKASMLGDAHGVLLRIGGRDAWRLRTSCDEVRLEDSIYLGRAGSVRRTEQIVMKGPLSGAGAVVKWALTREAG